MLRKYTAKYELFFKKYSRFFKFLNYFIKSILILFLFGALVYVVFWVLPILYNWPIADFKKTCCTYFTLFFNNFVSTLIRRLLMRHRRLFWGIHDEFFDVDDLRQPPKRKNFRKNFRHIFRLTRHKNWRRTWRFRDLVLRFEFFLACVSGKVLEK